MSKLFAKRRQRHFMMLLKYWRLVFNDHFVIALFFLFGALAYGYSQWLPQLGPHLWWSRWLLVLWMTVLVQVGRLATLIERPDPIFLLPRTDQMGGYLGHAFTYSLILAEVITACGVFVALPFAMTTEYLSPVGICGAFATGLLAKGAWMILARAGISPLGEGHRRLLIAGKWVLPLVSALACWLVNPLVGTAVAAVIVIALAVACRNLPLDWRLAVKTEQDRMYSVYRFFNLFTDVPSVQGNVRRRRWANGLVRLLTIPDHPWSYLYVRGFIRDTDISGIVIRLTLLAMVVVLLVPISWLNSLLVVLFVYLIATQLMPLFDQYDDNVFTHLYPVEFSQRQADFKNLLVRVTALVAGLIAIASLGLDLDWGRLVVNLVLACVEVILLTRLYFGVRIKKISEEY